MRRRLLLVSLALAACVPDTSSESEGAAETGQAEPFVEGMPAAGIQIAQVEANQGVGILIGDQGGEVGPADRTGYLVKERRTLIRGLWTLDPTFQPRSIRAVLHLLTPGGDHYVHDKEQLVEGESRLNTLAETLVWDVPEYQVVPGVTYRIDLFEVDTPPAPEVPPNVFPLDGSWAPVGIEQSASRITAVVVPFHYNDGAGCNTTPDTSATTIQLFHDLLYMMSPVQRVDIQMHAPIEWTSALSSFATVNAYLSELRTVEEASPEVFYYGLIDVCARGLGGAGGMAYGIPSAPPQPDQAYQRVSSGLSLADDPQWSAETFVHELGHSTGRLHVRCNGTEGGPDSTYPVEGGAVGEWGFGVLDFRLRHPTVYKDYMTYCHPTWVSTWGWNKVYPVLRELTGWSSRAPAATTKAVLVGTVLPSGDEHWHTLPGGIDGAVTTGEVSIHVEGDDGYTQMLTGVELEVPDADGSRMFAIPIGTDFQQWRRLVRVDGERRIAIPRHEIRELHREPRLRAPGHDRAAD